jgi:hypothetical protein
MVSIGYLREKFLKIPAWDTHVEFCSEPPLTIPKSAELGNEKGISPAPSPMPVRDINYQEHWVIPSDSSEESSQDLAGSEVLSVN